MDTIFVLNVGKQVIDIFSNNGSSPSSPFFDDKYTSELDTGAESFEFTTFANTRTSVTLEVGNYILFKYDGKYKLFQITETEDEHTEGEKLLTVYAEMAGMELLNDYCEPFTLEGNFITFMNRLLQDTNWVVGRYSANLLNNIQMVEVKEYTNVYKLIQSNLSTFGGVEIEFRVEFVGNTLVGQYIDCYASGERGNKTYRRFEYGEDIKGITRNRNINDLATAVIGIGKDNLTFKDIEWSKDLGKPCDKPLQQDFVVDIEANDIWNNNGKYIKTVFKCDAEDAEDLLQQSWDHLQEIKNPKFDYDVDLALTIEDYEDIRIGDTNYVVDFAYNPPILLEARVSKLEISLSDPRSNKCTLSNYKELVSILTQPVDQSMVDSMIQSKFPIGGEDIAMGAIGEGHISVTYYQAIKTDIMNATLANVDTLIADKADITELNALKIDVQNLSSLNADIENLKANKAEITDLTAANGKITNLESDLADVKTLVNGNLTSDNIQALHLTAKNTTIDNALIKDAMIDTVSANKINTGTLNTNNVVIESEDGGIVLSGSTQQFKDNNGQVRVQIGKDAQGNFTFCLFSQDGQGILLDETGIKAGAVPNGLIVNNMVSDNANIAGSKLDIASVITEINGNETSIKTSAIKFDDTGQSLLVAFNTLKNKVETIENVSIEGDLSSVMEQVTTNTTNLGVIQGQISSLIDNTTITKENGSVVQLKDEYSATKQTVDEISSKVGALETNYKKTLKSSSVQYYLSTSKISLNGGSWEDTAPEWSQDKYMWQRMKYVYTDGGITYGNPTCVAGAKGDTGETGATGPQGEKGDKGDSGIGITSITNYYLASNLSDGITTSTDGWTTTVQSVSIDKKYLWNYEKVIYSNNTDYITPPCIIGSYGEQGSTGATGRGIESITEYYSVSSSNVYNQSSWSTSVPRLTPTDKYLWNYEHIEYTDGTSMDTTKKVIGVYGDTGDKGDTGEKGQSLIASTPQWYLSTSDTTPTGGNWKDTMPTVTEGRYIWIRYKNEWANPTSTTYTTPVLEQVLETVKEVVSKQADFEQTIDGFKTTVSEAVTKVETFKVGGRNLWVIGDLTPAYETSGGITAQESATQYQCRKNIIPVERNTHLMYQVWNPNKVANTSNINRVAFFNSNKTYIKSFALPKLDGTSYQQCLITFPENTAYIRLGAICGVSEYDDSIQIKFEFGNQATDWTPAPEDQEDYIDTSVTTSEKNLNNNIDSAVSDAKNDILNEVDGKYVNSNEYAEFKKTTSSSIEQTSKDVELKFNTVNEGMQTVNGELKEFKNAVSTNIRFSGEGIDIGKSDSPFAVNINNQKMSFKENGIEVAYISNQEMRITDAVVENSLTLGNFMYLPRVTGNVSLIWDDMGNLIEYSSSYPNTTNNGYPTHNAYFRERPVAGQMYTIELYATLGSTASYWGVYNSGGNVDVCVLNNWEFRNGVAKKSFIWTQTTSDGAHTADNRFLSLYPMPHVDNRKNSTISYVKIYKGDDQWRDNGNLLRFNNIFDNGGKYYITASRNDHYIYTDMYCYLEAGVEYKFTCNCDCTNWGHSTTEDTVEAYLVYKDNADGSWTHKGIATNPATFTVATSGRWWLRLDVNKNGCKHWFGDIWITKA